MYKKLKPVSSPTRVWERRNWHNETKIRRISVYYKKNRIFALKMTENQLKYYLSSPRFNVYLAQTDNDTEKAYRLYKANIELSEAFYPVLSVLEICLRNAINEQLKQHFNDPNWFKNHLPPEFRHFISEAEQKILLQQKNVTADKIIAELNFGFWNRLFNRNNAELLWKPLRLIFKNIPKELRQRDTIADNLHSIRKLRNRVYHYEPIFRNLGEVEKQYNEMISFIAWLDKDLPKLLDDIDRFKEIFSKAKAI